MSESKTSTRRLAAIAKQKTALELRAAGVHYEDIAIRLGYKNRSGAQHAVEAALKRTLSAPANELRQIQMAQLDIALRAIWPAVLRGNISAVLAFLKISERVARLTGLDAPTKIAPVMETPDGEQPYQSIMDDETRAARIMAIVDVARKRKAEAERQAGNVLDPGE
jgi:hypothetical protein